MNRTNTTSILTRRFARRAVLVAVLATGGCATERPAPLALATLCTPPAQHDMIAPVTSTCETFDCTP